MDDAATIAITDEALAAEGWKPHPTDGFVAHVGGLYERQHEGKRQFGLLTGPQHANRNGVVHGGMIVTFIDRAFGQTARQAADAPRAATVSLTEHFLAPLKIGVFATIEPHVVRKGGTLVFMEGTVTCDGEAIASAQGVWRVAKRSAAKA